jgi:hypothetical protein
MQHSTHTLIIFIASSSPSTTLRLAAKSSWDPSEKKANCVRATELLAMDLTAVVRTNDDATENMVGIGS